VAINAKAVTRVIIHGEWIWVERGTFDVVDFEFEDNDGNLLNRSKEPAYFFVSTNGDPYFGPLAGVSLMKLDTQILEEGFDAGEGTAKQPHAIGPGGDDDSLDAGPPESPSADDEPGSVPLFADESPDAGPPPDEDEPESRDSVPLFAEDVADDEPPPPPPDEEPARVPLFADELPADDETVPDELPEPAAPNRRGGLL
jgi:hypothetical protein